LKDSCVRRYSARAVVLAISLVTLFLLIPSTAFAQLTPNYTVGTGTAPSIDGVWQPGEWSNAVELPVAYSNVSSIQPAYLRLTHDDLWLYFLYDVPFDTTPPSTQTQLPFIVLVLDGTAKEFSPGDLNDAQIVGEVTSSGGMAIGYVGSNNPNYHPYLGQVIRNVTMAQRLGTSPHSNIPHRIWEGKIPLQPIIMNSPKADDLSPIIGFNTEVQDALGNSAQLQPLSNSYAVTLLKIAPYPVPENVNPIIPLLFAITILGIYAKKRNGRSPNRLNSPLGR
jgi:hypothetical protein